MELSQEIVAVTAQVKAQVAAADAVEAFELAALTTQEEIAAAEALYADALDKVQDIADRTVRVALMNRINDKKAKLDAAKKGFENVAATLKAAEDAVKAYEDFQITKYEEVAKAKELAKVAADAVAKVTDEAKKAALNTRIVEQDKKVAAKEAELAPIEIKEAVVTGTKKINVVFNKPVDTTKAIVTVKKGNSIINVTPTWNETKTEVTLATSVALEVGDYTVSVTGIETAKDKDVAKFTVAPERIDNIVIDADAYRKADVATTIELSYKLVNQYGEDITSKFEPNNFAVSASKGSATVSVKGKITINDIAADVTSVTVSLVDKTFAKTAYTTVNIKAAKVLSEITINAPSLKKDQTRLTPGNDYIIKYTAKDQYGNDYVLDTQDLEKITFVSSNTTIINPSSAFEVKDVDGDGKKELTVDIGAFEGLKEITLTAIVNATGKSSKATFTVYGTATADAPTLVAPSTRFGVNDTDFRVQLTMKNQFGEEMKADEILAAVNGLTITSGNKEVFDINATPLVKEGDKVYVSLTGKGTGTANLTVTVNATGKSTTLPITVVEAKYAASMTLTPNYVYAVKGASITLKATFKDQYGDEIKSGNSKITFAVDNNSFGNAPSDSTVTDMVNTGVTFTAAEYGKVTKVTVKLYDTTGQKVIDTKEVVLTAVNADADLVYAIEDLGTVAAISNEQAAYEKTIKVYAKDANGNKVALPSTGVIQSASTIDSKLDTTALNSYKIKAATKEADGVANFSLVVNTNKGVAVIPGTVTFSKAAPVAQKIEALAGDTPVTKVKLSAGQINLFDNNNLKFKVTDQYGVSSYLTSDNYVTVFVRDNDGNVQKLNNATQWTATAGTYKITAVTSNGLSVTVDVVVE